MESLKRTTEGATPPLRLVIIVIVVPLAVILPKKHHHKVKAAKVLFPVYIYPETNTTWDPLYEAITTHPELDFVVIVNPSSGPGSSPPSTQYQVAVKRLSTYSNVQKVGYIPTNYADRNITEVLEAVATYSNWTSESSTLSMDGIFFDEIPYDWNSTKSEYLTRINEAVKSSSGIGSPQLIIHNPGTIPDSRYNDTTTDITVVFEQSYSYYETQVNALDDLSTSRRGNYSYMLHSMPTMSNNTMKNFIDDLSDRAEYLFLTTLEANYYEKFDPKLEVFCDLVPTSQT
ncbi:spherulin 4-like cell surface protein [Penicillium angulare]|uniref:spherulin 4-like cell surface protein n=1 Tax=Penicillium angulare TaxID=116970 RepID=UPI0025401C79|nr:spherulin 4-like cell surface protein [Penicillium angulare]KAJ5261172.1 spherulin 4-like cell surface protein [Penicillium angulare]